MNTHFNTKRNGNCSFDNSKLKQSGFSLIEVMVASLMLSIGILGVTSLQLVGLKGSHQSYMKIQAMTVVQSLTEKMHANKLGVVNGSYVESSTNFACGAVVPCNTVASQCTSAQIAQIDLDNIICGHQSGTAPRVGGVISATVGDHVSFVDGELDITCLAGDCSSGQIQISMQWQERKFGDEDPNNILPEKDSIVVNTRILK